MSSGSYGFEGSYLGDESRIAEGDCMECKICWYVYDPEKGDPVWQIPPNTPFARLPEHWHCPECDADKTQFMVIESN